VDQYKSDGTCAHRKTLTHLPDQESRSNLEVTFRILLTFFSQKLLIVTFLTYHIFCEKKER